MLNSRLYSFRFFLQVDPPSYRTVSSLRFLIIKTEVMVFDIELDRNTIPAISLLEKSQILNNSKIWSKTV